MRASASPMVVLSDVHLGHDAAGDATADLAALIRAHEGHEIVLAGDVFDLSADPPTRDPRESVEQLFKKREALCHAFRAHLLSGNAITLLAGNHDWSTGLSGQRERLLTALELSDASRLSFSPWFARRGSVHIEHGNLYDPDNAPVHPLCPWSPEVEPLGVSLTRRFLVPSRAAQFAHAHETTPLAGLLRAARLFGVKTPWIVVRYFATAIALCFDATRQHTVLSARTEGELGVESFSLETGLSPEIIQALAGAGASPTHHDFRATFMRLYFDRVITSVAATGGAAVFALTASPPAALLALASAAYLAHSVASSGSRYGDLVEGRLRDAARAVRDLTQAGLVVFGHSHCEDTQPGYENCGSFAFPARAGRPYLLVSEAGVAERRRWPG